MSPRIPQSITSRYEVHEWRHASAILAYDFAEEWSDILEILGEFKLYRSQILTPGGRKSGIAEWIDHRFAGRGWRETSFTTKIVVDDQEFESPTHKVDCFKNHVGLEIEWNNKDPFFDRDLNNFRLLFELRTLSVGVIVTRSDELQNIFNELSESPKVLAADSPPPQSGGGESAGQNLWTGT